MLLGKSRGSRASPVSREKASAHMLQLVFLWSTLSVWVPTSSRHGWGTPTTVTPFSYISRVPGRGGRGLVQGKGTYPERSEVL